LSGQQARPQIGCQHFLHGSDEAAAGLVGGEELDTRIGGVILADQNNDFRRSIVICIEQGTGLGTEILSPCGREFC